MRKNKRYRCCKNKHFYLSTFSFGGGKTRTEQKDRWTLKP